MNEKTEELRDIFTKVTDETTVTEQQADTHGTLASDVDVDDRLADVVTDMRDDLDFTSSLDTDQYVAVVRGFYADETDADIAADLDTDPETVTDARFDLHLVRDDDADPDVEAAVRERLAADPTTDPDADLDADLADDIDVDADAVASARRVVRTRREIDRVNDRYRSEFRNLLADHELATRLTEDIHEDGLQDATEGQETNTQM
ncbi:conditioned medium-induced protein 4 [Halocalculus aciditolerans]|uniref:Conditioned medium-induced protein 4 n=1 Tax=Halocalculus aciditolerans TaxID=1383812 RepID=A0A830EZH1_9EURY|nr:conditioned medium-induced protein 4 [Halocalculus aciditolerans]GGL47601.1 hypothetical protein GCM10009039_02290 [Halocalculus aciditolerans]